MNRIYDIVVFGATGFTGNLVAKYLDANAPKHIKWAIAGRNKEKLKTVVNQLKQQPPVLIGDTNNLESLIAITQLAKIVITTVGPYALYGENLVKACLATSTHYCDITGEPDFVKNLLVNYHEDAIQKGVYIINCCGFDSIPADAGAYFTAKQLPANEQKTVKAFMATNGSFSGGTYASALNAMAEFSKKGKQKSRKPTGQNKHKSTLKNTIYFDKELNRWAIPLPIIDPWIVKRSASYLENVYGSNFDYNQYLGLKTLPQVVGLCATVGTAFVGAQIPFIKNMMLQYRKSGEGPSEQERAKSSFKITFIGQTATKQIRTQVSGGDPGYTETSKMISETALTLLEGLGSLKVKGGVLTPITCLNDKLITKLQSKGIKFEVLN